MLKQVIIVTLVTFIITLFSVFAYVDNLYEHIDELNERNAQTEQYLLEASQELAEYEARGGVEQAYNPDVPGAVIGFPIDDDDFLRYTSPFGLRESPFLGVDVHHTGVDIATVWRAQVTAVADGEVIEHWPAPGNHGGTNFRGHEIYGAMILIDHGDFQSLYAHMDSTRVRTGQRVSEGDILGRVGSTGRTTGNHLHFELFVEGERVNPLLYMKEIEGR